MRSRNRSQQRPVCGSQHQGAMQSGGTGSQGNINNSPMNEGIPDLIHMLCTRKPGRTNISRSLEVDSVPDGSWLSNDGSVLVLPTHRDPESQMQLSPWLHQL